jgi:uncharacterized protein (DUF1697 family)
MPTHVALLRGINVGGRNRVAMAGPARGGDFPCASASGSATMRNWATVTKLLAMCNP